MANTAHICNASHHTAHTRGRISPRSQHAVMTNRAILVLSSAPISINCESNIKGTHTMSNNQDGCIHVASRQGLIASQTLVLQRTLNEHSTPKTVGIRQKVKFTLSTNIQLWSSSVSKGLEIVTKTQHSKLLHLGPQALTTNWTALPNKKKSNSHGLKR